MEEFKVKTSVRNFILALILLLTTNILMGLALVSMSKASLREQMEQRMLDVANTAAAQIDGDVLKTLTADDKDTEDYQHILFILRSFLDNIDLDYIYSIRPDGDGTYSFTIDPDRVEPAEFGSEIEATDALLVAASGKPCAETKPHTDAWGRFYSAYSPIRDSQNNVVGLIGVDFNADYFDKKLNANEAAAIIITMVALSVGIVLSFIIMSENRRKFSKMLKDLAELRKETDKLDMILMKSSIKKLDFLPDSENKLLKTLASGENLRKNRVDEYGAVSSGISFLYEKLKSYAKFVDDHVYIDDTTGAMNKAAYKEKIKSIDEKAKDGINDYGVAFFDINALKKIYTHYGFEAGEKLMFECAKLLRMVYGKENVYHVTGDEFVVIVENTTLYVMKANFDKFEALIDQYNEEHVMENNLSVAKGLTMFDSEKHKNYRQVFIDAKAACDKDKDEFYGRTEKK